MDNHLREAALKASPGGGEAPEKFRVMVVEDDAVNRMVATRLLSAIGGECETAENGEECLALLGRRKFDIVVMDWRMPVMDGVAATRAIRSLAGPVADVPVIGCTAEVISDGQEAMLGAGCDDCLAKPLRIERLAESIAAVLRRRALKSDEA